MRAIQFSGQFGRQWLPSCATAATVSLLIGLCGLSVQAADPVRDYEIAPRLLALLPLEPYAAAFSEDGRWLATGHNDGSILVWRTEDGIPVRRYDGHRDTIAGLSFSATGDRLASAACDGTVRMWSTSDGAALHVLETQPARLTCVAISPDGQRVAAGAYDGNVRLWTDFSALPIVSPSEPSAVIRCISFSSDGEVIAAGDSAGTIRLLSGADATVVQTVTTQDRAIQTAVFAPGGASLVTGSKSGRVSAWNSQTLEAFWQDAETAPAHEQGVVAAAFTADARLLATADQSGNARIWDAESLERTSELKGHQDQILAIGFQPDAQGVVTVSRDRRVYTWSARLPPTPRLASLSGAAEKLWCVAVAPDQSTLYAAGRKGFCGMWDLRTGAKLREVPGFSRTVDDIDVSPDGLHLAACGWGEPAVLVVDVQSGEIVANRNADADVRCVRFAPDSVTLAAAREDGKVDLWTWREPEQVRTVNVSEKAAYDVAFTPDGQRFAACGGDWRTAEPGFLKLFATTDLSVAGEFNEHQHAVRAAAFNGDGTRLASTDEAGVTIVWNVETRLPLARLNNGAGTRPLAWSVDGNRLAVGLHDGSIHVWDVANEEIVGRYRSEDDVFGLAFGGEGTVLFSTSGEPRVEVWPAAESAATIEQIRGWVP